MGEYAPPLIIPLLGKYLWDFFGDLNSSISRIDDGVCKLIPPSEYSAFFELSGLLITPIEYDILKAMDRVYCDEVNKELQSQRNKREERMKAEQEAAKAKNRTRRR